MQKWEYKVLDVHADTRRVVSIDGESTIKIEAIQVDLDKVENDLNETKEKLRQNLSSLTSSTKAIFGQKPSEVQKSLKIIHDELSRQSDKLRKQRNEVAYILEELSAGRSIDNDRLEKYQPSLVEYLKEIGEDGWEVVSSVVTRTYGEGGWISRYSIIAKRLKQGNELIGIGENSKKSI